VPHELILNEGEESWPTIDLAYWRDHYDPVKPNNVFRLRERSSSSAFGTSTLESAKEICEVPVGLISAKCKGSKGGTKVFQFQSGMKPGKNTQTPVHENPTNNYQVWVNQYYLWYHRLYPKKNTPRQTVVEKAQAHWNSSSDITELLEGLIEETPEDLPPLVKQTNISQFFHTSTITAVNNLGGSNISNDSPPVSSEEDSSQSDHLESMVDPPPIANKWWPNTVQTTSDSLYPPTMDVYDVYRRGPHKFLLWLLGEDSSDRDVNSLGLKLNSLPLTMYSNAYFNTLIKLWYQCDFPALENNFKNQIRQRRMKKRSRTAASVHNETLERAMFKHAVLDVIDTISEEKSTDIWIEPFQTSANRYLPFFQEVIKVMKKSIHNSRRRVLHGNNPAPKWSILIHNDSSLSWDGVLGDLVGAAEIGNKPA